MNGRERVFIGLGSNMGSRQANCLKAIDKLREAPVVTIVSGSPFYETSPMGVLGQRPFVNAVIEVRTTLGPLGLLDLLKGVEQELGRGRGRRWGPRVIDLDILIFARRIINLPMLTVPHPRLHERGFALVPLLDIAPDIIHPVFNLSMKGLYSRCKSRIGLKKLTIDKIG